MRKKPDATGLFLLCLITAFVAVPGPRAFAQAQVFAPLIRPFLPILTSWIAGADFATIAGTAAAAAFIFTKNKPDPSGTLPPLQGKAINSVDLYTTDPLKPAISVSLEPSGPPKDMPGNFVFDYGTGLSFDPVVNVSSQTAGDKNLGFTVCAMDLYYGHFEGRPSELGVILGNYYGGRPWTPSAGTDKVDSCSWYGNGGSLSGYLVRSSSYQAPAGTKQPISVANAPMWPSDGHCTVSETVVNGVPTFSGNTQDPDCFLGGARGNPPAPLPPGISAGPSSITATNPGGGSTTITINPDGTVTINTKVPSATGSTTTENVITLAPAVPGSLGNTYVTGQTTNVYPGTGTSTGATPIPQTVPVGATAPVSSSPTAPTETPDLCATHPNIEACQVITPGAPSPTDGLYTAQTGLCTTFGCVLDSFGNKIKASQLWSSTVGFFRASDASASCGGFSTSITLFGRTIDLNIDSFFCGSLAEKVYTALGVVLLISVSIAAFSIAIL